MTNYCNVFLSFLFQYCVRKYLVISRVYKALRRSVSQTNNAKLLPVNITWSCSQFLHFMLHTLCPKKHYEFISQKLLENFCWNCLQQTSASMSDLTSYSFPNCRCRCYLLTHTSIQDPALFRLLKSCLKPSNHICTCL